MKKTLAVLGAAAALSATGAGLASAQSTTTATTTTQSPATTTTTTPAPGGTTTTKTPSKEAQTLCGALSTGERFGLATGSLSGEFTGADCAETVDEALTKARAGDIQGVLALLQGTKSTTGTTTSGTTTSGTSTPSTTVPTTTQASPFGS